MIILDTDIMIDILREYPPAIKWLKTVGNEKIILPGYVAMELIQGCKNKKSQKDIKDEISNYNISWPESDCCNKALSLFTNYHLSHELELLMHL